VNEEEGRREEEKEKKKKIVWGRDSEVKCEHQRRLGRIA